MTKIAIHGRNFSTETAFYVQEIIDILEKQKVNISLSSSFYHAIKASPVKLPVAHVYQSRNDLKSVDYVFSLGGDGTLLETLTHIGDLEKPILGINLGRLGFLATINKKEIKSAMECLFDKKFTYDVRSLIHLDSNRNIFDNLNFALNEFTVTKKDTSSMIVVNCWINGQFLNSYWGDGLMVSTPTGSTGYSLSCGGPVMLPHSKSFIITPINPHNLNVRPMVVSDSSVLSFEIMSREDTNFLTSLDSRSRTVDSSDKMSICKENFCMNLIKLEGYTFLDTLRNKLNWGLDARN